MCGEGKALHIEALHEALREALHEALHEALREALRTEALHEALHKAFLCARDTLLSGPHYIPDSLYTCLCQVYPLYTPR